MSWSEALLTHALCSSPESLLPASVYVSHSSHFLTINDLYPKSTYHQLILPRVPFTLNNGSILEAGQLSSLQTFFARNKKEVVLEVLEKMEEEVGDVVNSMQEGMRREKGWEWEVVWGFHAVPSMKHLHLHVYSRDLLSDSLKNKKHYNSFHPMLGFFLPLETVKEWVETENKVKLALPASSYDPLLKLPLKSFYTDEEYKTIPKLKVHLEEEWRRRAKVKGLKQ